MIQRIFPVLAAVFLSVSISNTLLAQEIEDFVYDSKGKRDPFIPLITQRTRLAMGLEDVQAIDDIILEGIVWDPRGGSIAILNGVIVREDQKIGNIKIKKIEQKSVSLFINEIEYKINLVKEGDEAGERE